MNPKTVYRTLRYHITLLATMALALVLHTNVWGQTYTYTPGPNCNGTWSDGDCWTVTANNDPAGCTGSTATTPPTSPSSTCKVDVIINDAVTFSGSPSFGGTFSSITFASGGSLDITGNATIKSSSTVQVFFEEADQTFNVAGEMTIEASANLQVYGAPRAEEEEISDYLILGSLYMRGKSRLLIDENAGMDVIGTTKVHTPSNNSVDRAEIKVDGIFRTTSIYISGNSHLSFEVAENAEVRASEPGGTLDMNGNSTLSFKGDFYQPGGDADGESYIDVGGDITTNGSGAKIIADDATLYTCDAFPASIQKEEKNEGKFVEGNCRILPVIWLDVQAIFLPHEGAAELFWSTSKEWETSHYEVERSVDGIDNFQTIGNVQAMGWADTMSEYAYQDVELPSQANRLYYRLKQVDMDGTFEYSKTVSISVPTQEDTGKSWRAFPNPTQGNQLTLSLQNGLNYGGEPVTVRLYSPSLSSPILSTTLASATAPIELDQLIMHAPKGLLIVEVNWGGYLERIKVLKQ